MILCSQYNTWTGVCIACNPCTMYSKHHKQHDHSHDNKTFQVESQLIQHDYVANTILGLEYALLVTHVQCTANIISSMTIAMMTKPFRLDPRYNLPIMIICSQYNTWTGVCIASNHCTMYSKHHKKHNHSHDDKTFQVGSKVLLVFVWFCFDLADLAGLYGWNVKYKMQDM